MPRCSPAWPSLLQGLPGGPWVFCVGDHTIYGSRELAFFFLILVSCLIAVAAVSSVEIEASMGVSLNSYETLGGVELHLLFLTNEIIMLFFFFNSYY